jgi:hypothetical protein
MTNTPAIPIRPMATLSYKTFLKRIVVQSLRDAFNGHPDPTVASTFVSVDYPHSIEDFPVVIVKFYERDISNIGVGHVEYLPTIVDGEVTAVTQYYHRWYKGDVEFEIFGLSSLDRDTVADAFIEVIAMFDATPGGAAFWNRMYDSNSDAFYGEWHYVVLNQNVPAGFGEMQQIAPWMPEDVLVYQTSYRIPVMGEFYSNTPNTPNTPGFVDEVDLYVWDPDDPEDTDPSTFPGGVIPSDDYMKIDAPS